MQKGIIKFKDVSHDFHLVMTKEMKKKIERLSKKLKKSLSKTAVYIIERSLNFFKEHHFAAEESPVFSKYRNIFWKKHLHVFLNKTLYRKIKHLSDTHMAFSVAIVVRWLFNYYFDNLYDKKKNKENKELIEKKDNEIADYENFIKTWNKIITAEQLSGNFFYQLTFNDKFCLVGFNYLHSG